MPEPPPIEDYALLGDTNTAALVSRGGSLDWLCAPRFDSPACFAALLGGAGHGRWLIAPAGALRATHRHYRDGTLVLETEFETDEGAVRLIDFMPCPPGDERVDVVRIVQGVRGTVPMHMELVMRFDYGRIVPWLRREEGGLRAVAGPESLRLRSPVELTNEDFATRARFSVAAGESAAFALTWTASHRPMPETPDVERALETTDAWWRDWSGRYAGHGAWREAVQRSLLTLKALTYAPTGGIVAAPTSSLPEQLGGRRNWDYRFCWLRDAAFTLYVLLTSGYVDEARAWRDWLLRAVAGRPEQLQVLYGIAGERRVPEMELDWLPGYAGSAPVRSGNGAHGQVQLDAYGSIMDMMHVARMHKVDYDHDAWRVERVLLDALESRWREPDASIWEVRGKPRQFTYSKVLAWVAFDRAVKAVERHGLEGPVDRWRKLRDAVHRDVCANGYDTGRKAFVQYYGGSALDASLLMIPKIGFLPARDPRVAGTVEAVQRELTKDGFVQRYLQQDDGVDGLAPGEGAFLPCSFWLADNLAMMRRRDEARELFERLLAVRNDVGLLAEEYDPRARRQLGNFPQALSHIALINTADNLARG
ncbi:MAG TPA: glycoside hydrolase family 15 protein [Burkholderiales bacterium]|nr:glycoside hydrolase family 15 protein [Burkholderiales bacterium]